MPQETIEFDAMLRVLVAKIVREEVASALAEVRAPAQGEHLTTEEAAQIARVTNWTVRKWIREGKLTRYTINRRLRVRRDELEKLVRADGKRQAPVRTRRARTPDKSPEELAAIAAGLA